MPSDKTHYTQVDGTRLALKNFHHVAHGFSIRPLRTTFHVRNDWTGEIVKPPGQAGRDALMMALYYGGEKGWEYSLKGYAWHCFGPDEVERHLNKGLPADAQQAEG